MCCVVQTWDQQHFLMKRLRTSTYLHISNDIKINKTFPNDVKIPQIAYQLWSR